MTDAQDGQHKTPEQHICSICGLPYHGFGNNPYPYPAENGERCCNECNSLKVIPARIARFYSQKPVRKGT